MNPQHQHHQNGEDDQSQRQGWSASKWAMIGFLLIAGYFLFTEHRAHVVQYLPFLLLLACIPLHMLHGGHGGHGGHGRNAGDSDEYRDEQRGSHKH